MKGYDYLYSSTIVLLGTGLYTSISTKIQEPSDLVSIGVGIGEIVLSLGLAYIGRRSQIHHHRLARGQLNEFITMSLEEQSNYIDKIDDELNKNIFKTPPLYYNAMVDYYNQQIEKDPHRKGILLLEEIAKKESNNF